MVSRADPLLLSIAVLITLGSMGVANCPRYELPFQVSSLQTRDDGATACLDVLVSNPRPTRITLQDWLIDAGDHHLAVASPISVERLGRATLCFDRLAACRGRERLTLDSVQITFDGDERPERRRVRLGEQLSCRGLSRETLDADTLGFDRLLRTPDSEASTSAVSEIVRGEPLDANGWSEVRLAVGDSNSRLAALAELGRRETLRFELPLHTSPERMIAARVLARLSAAEGWIGLADGQPEQAQAAFLRTGRFGAQMARSESAEGRSVIRALAGMAIAHYAVRGLLCHAQMAPDDPSLLRRSAVELRNEASLWSEAFDSTAIFRDESRQEAADRAVGTLLPGFAWLRAHAGERDEQARAEMQRGLETTAARVVSAASRASIALAVRGHRLATGSLPGSLDVLVPEWLESLPRDPFRTDGAPLGYRANGDGSFVVWSVGEDGEEDGGDTERDDVLAIASEPQPCAALAGVAAHPRS